ncbi:sodium-coupled neutral amino acid symporter 1 [Oenanthe melanoleuca]|uniref:sodium-coupled neutral amino acid symporter 1 n=1 Tax=Oenanthe melanoleuca TaxID=2939378 RepID=UPI0024C1B5D3|nr:sodium-coupled neutral amino acid symporter 1 [Oenanthe melanoleuca]
MALQSALQNLRWSCSSAESGWTPENIGLSVDLLIADEKVRLESVLGPTTAWVDTDLATVVGISTQHCPQHSGSKTSQPYRGTEQGTGLVAGEGQERAACPPGGSPGAVTSRPTQEFFFFCCFWFQVTLLSIYSIHLLLVCSKETGCMVYEKLGEQVFGTPGKMIVFGATSLQNIGAMLSYLFIVKNELPSAIKFLMGKEETFLEWYVDGRILVVTVTFCIILPLCLLKNLGYLGYTSGFSLSCMVFFLVVVIYKKFQIPCDGQGLNATLSILSNSSEHTCKPKYVIFNSKTVYALPTIAFAFVCHPSVLPIYSELKDRSQKKMQLVSNISFFAMFLMYFMTAIFGYLTFYENVQSDLLHKYQSKDDILILTVRLAVIVAVILTVPVLFFTVRSSLFEMARKTKFDLCRHVLVTFVLLVIINLLVIFIPSMKDIFGVVGVTSANMLIFILPSSLYLKITQQDGSKLTQRIWASLFLALGVLFSLVSIPLVIYDWVQSGGSDEGH